MSIDTLLLANCFGAAAVLTVRVLLRLREQRRRWRDLERRLNEIAANPDWQRRSSLPYDPKLGGET